MNAKQLERASYLAAHAILSANTGAPHLATPGARRSHTIDVLAATIKSIFELHCSALDEAGEWRDQLVTAPRPAAESFVAVSGGRRSQKLQPMMQELH